MTDATRKLSGYVLWGVWYDAVVWKDVLDGVAAALYFHHASHFEIAESIGNPPQYPRVARSPEGMRDPRQIRNSPYWMETNFNRFGIMDFARDLLRTFGYKDADLRAMSELIRPNDDAQTLLG